MKQRYCSVKGCRNKHKAKKYCALHYRQKVFKKNNPLYRIWHNMNQRCYNKNSTRYINWGGRGIKVCSEWRNNYSAFAAYVSERPHNRTLDRINNNGNYEPGNVKWSTHKQQAANRRNAKVLI